MPQLMPMKWILTNLVMLLLLMLMCVFYSESMNDYKLKSNINHIILNKNLWYW